MRRALRASAVAALVLCFAPAARATSVLEFPDNGSEQEGRGGAWVARASDPLATFYNPAGLAGQQTRITLQANFSTQNTCFTRLKANNDTTPDGTKPGSSYPQVCNNGGVFADPQLAFTFRLNDRIGLGVAVLGPSANGNQAWPDFVNGSTPSPQRYMLVKSNVVLLTPTIGIGAEVVDNLRLGAAFIAGTAPTIDFINAAPAIADATAPAPGTNDLRAEAKAHDYFIPGFILSALWSPVDRIDVAGWFKYMSPIDATGDVISQAYYYQYGQTSPEKVVYGSTHQPNCNNPAQTTNPCGNGNNASIKVVLPMEAKLGVRYHQPRAGVAVEPHKRDPMAQDAFDLEADLTWANDSAFDKLQVRFPSGPTGLGVIPANPAVPGFLPPNSDSPRNFSDVYGVRVGGDWNVMPDQVALRAGGFYETQAASSTNQAIDFDAASRFGFALGGTYRVRLGAEKRQAIDFMLAYGHVFYATLTNDSQQGLHALSGEQCAAGSTPNANGTCSNGNQWYRSLWPVNLGSITSSVNVLNVGASYAF